MELKEIENFSKEISSKIKIDYNIKPSNWFNIGGLVKVFFKPDNLNDLILFLKKFGLSKKIFILGAGSNILFTDKIFDGIVIKLGKNFSNISLLPNDIIVAGSSVSDKKLSDFAMENNIKGFEFLSCIPGTIGGGLKINSGCFGREFKDILVSIQAIDRKGKVITMPAEKIKFGYRSSPIDKDLIFLSASFKGEKGDKKEISKNILYLKQKKDLNQPTRIKTGGSTFKNPKSQTSKKAWELIKSSVSLSQKFGDAEISSKHCNFLVNTKNATFEDMKKLIDYIKNNVLSKTGIHLETEIEIID
tara:strand:+ start:843 stop:1751 length:909 start_codon:yes stop_codon:yes gene_type:complete